MKKCRVIPFALFVLLLSACQTSNTPDITVNKDIENKEPLQQPEQKNQDLLTRVDQLSIGMNEEEVRSLFGANFFLVQNAMEGNETWRYEFNADESYRFADQGIDTVDLDGLKEGKVEELLFIDWNEEGRVQGATLYRKSEQEGHFDEYRLLEDGSIQKSTHSFP